jgi:PIN domain nuclease of toxin-antitoxin system
MKLLLDTHSFLWFIGGDERLSSTAQTLIEDINNGVFLSVASL